MLGILGHGSIQDQQELIIKFLLSIASSFRNESSPPRSGSLKDPTNIYIKNTQTHPKASLRRKGSGAGRNITRKVSKSNTFPIQISFIIVETSGGTMSVGLWFRSPLILSEYKSSNHIIRGIIRVLDLTYIILN